MKKLLTTVQIAEYLGLKERTVRKQASLGQIPHLKINNRLRFDIDEIDSWLADHARGKMWHILVIDDEPVIGELFKASLHGSKKFRVTAATCGAEALELIGDKRFDAIFLDLIMPDVNGAELFRRIRNVDKDVPVAIITGYPDSELLVQANQYYPISILIKPFNPEQIQQAARALIGVHKK
jgi:excisionase family DNA binding protein